MTKSKPPVAVLECSYEACSIPTIPCINHMDRLVSMGAISLAWIWHGMMKLIDALSPKFGEKANLCYSTAKAVVMPESMPLNASSSSPRTPPVRCRINCLALSLSMALIRSCSPFMYAFRSSSPLGPFCASTRLSNRDIVSSISDVEFV
jgi:hypothetical protein